MTLSEFQSWALAQGQVGKYDDGQFVGQCVSLVNQYCYRVLGVPAGAWGHAYAWAEDSNPNRQYFDKVNSLQDGDVVVYGTNFTPQYGHIGIYNGGQLLDQNGHQVLHVAVGVLFKGYNCILRKKGGTVSNSKEILRIVAGEVEGYGIPGVYEGKYDNELAAAWGGQPIENFISHGFQQAQAAGTLKQDYIKKIADLEKQLADAQTAEYIEVDKLYRKK